MSTSTTRRGATVRHRTLISEPCRLLDDPYRDAGGNPHRLEVGPIPCTDGRHTVVDGPGHQRARVQSGNVSVNSSSAKTGAHRSAISAATRTDSGGWSTQPRLFLGWVPARYRRRISRLHHERHLNSGACCRSRGKTGVGKVDQQPRQPRGGRRTQEYRGLKLTMQRRSASGLNINANYTLVDVASPGDVPNAQFGIGFTNPARPDYATATAKAIDAYRQWHGRVPDATWIAACSARSLQLALSASSTCAPEPSVDHQRSRQRVHGQANQRPDRSPTTSTAPRRGELFKPGGVRTAGAGRGFGTHERNSLTGRESGRSTLAVSRLVPIASTQTGASRRRVQPAHTLQLGDSRSELQLGVSRPHHDADCDPASCSSA